MNIIKLPKTSIPFQLIDWCEKYFNKNKKIPTQKEIEKANVILTKKCIARNSIYGICTKDYKSGGKERINV